MEKYFDLESSAPSLPYTQSSCNKTDQKTSDQFRATAPFESNADRAHFMASRGRPASMDCSSAGTAISEGILKGDTNLFEGSKQPYFFLIVLSLDNFTQPDSSPFHNLQQLNKFLPIFIGRSNWFHFVRNCRDKSHVMQTSDQVRFEPILKVLRSFSMQSSNVV